MFCPLSALGSWGIAILAVTGFLYFIVKQAEKTKKAYMEMYEKSLSVQKAQFEKSFANQKEMIELFKEIRDLLKK